MARFRVWAQEDTPTGFAKWALLAALAWLIWPLVSDAYQAGPGLPWFVVVAGIYLFVKAASWIGVPIPRCPGNIWVRALLLLPILFLFACDGHSEMVASGVVGLAVGTVAGVAVVLVGAIVGSGED